MSRLTINDLYSEPVLQNANRMVKQGAVTLTEDPNVFKVKGSKTYTVRRVPLGLDEYGDQISDEGVPYMTCDCPNGLARGGRPNCKHTAAAIIVIQQNEDEAEDELEEGDAEEFMIIGLIDE